MLGQIRRRDVGRASHRRGGGTCLGVLPAATAAPSITAHLGLCGIALGYLEPAQQLVAVRGDGEAAAVSKWGGTGGAVLQGAVRNHTQQLCHSQPCSLTPCWRTCSKTRSSKCATIRPSLQPPSLPQAHRTRPHTRRSPHQAPLQFGARLPPYPTAPTRLTGRGPTPGAA